MAREPILDEARGIKLDDLSVRPTVQAPEKPAPAGLSPADPTFFRRALGSLEALPNAPSLEARVFDL